MKYGKQIFKDICTKYNKFNTKDILVEELIKLLKNEHRYLYKYCDNTVTNLYHNINFVTINLCFRNLPDPQLESRQPYIYKQLSSIFVNIPEGNYGTRYERKTKRTTFDIFTVRFKFYALYFSEHIQYCLYQNWDIWIYLK